MPHTILEQEILKSIFKYAIWNSDHIIWKIKPSELGYLVVEVRDPTKFQACLIVLHYKDELQVLNTIYSKERWWFTLKEVVQDKVLISCYKKGRKPEIDGIEVVEIPSGNVMFQKKGFTYKDWNEKQMVISSIEDLEKEETFIFTDYKGFDHSFQVILPILYTIDSKYFESLLRFAAQYWQKDKIIQACYYLEYNEYIIISYIFEENKILEQNLCIFSTDGNKMLEICLNRNLNGFHMESFMIFDNKLFILSEKKTIILIDF